MRSGPADANSGVASSAALLGERNAWVKGADDDLLKRLGLALESHRLPCGRGVTVGIGRSGSRLQQVLRSHPADHLGNTGAVGLRCAPGLSARLGVSEGR